jgi:uncharacterized Zn finger protein (UPF0148 family)
VKKAKKKMKEQEEERILAEQRAKVEVERAAQKKAEEEEAATMAKAEEEALVAKIKAEEEAAAKAKAEEEVAVARAAAEEEAKRMAAEEAAKLIAEEEAALAMEAEERAIEAAEEAADEAELKFAFTDQDLFGAEEEARLEEEERLLQEALFGKTSPDTDRAARLEEEERLFQEALFGKTHPDTDRAAHAKLANEARVAEETRAAEAANPVEALRLAEEEEARLEEEERLPQEALFGKTPLDADRAAQAKLANEARVAEEARAAEAAKLVEEVRLAEEEERMALEALCAAEEEERLALGEETVMERALPISPKEQELLSTEKEEKNLVEEALSEEEQVALSVVVQEALQGPVTEEQLALRVALDALHAAEEEERLAQEAAEEDSLLEDMLSKEQTALRVAEEEERLALQVLKDAEEGERLCLEALRAAEEEERMALLVVIEDKKNAEEEERLALEARKAAEEEDRLAQEAVRAEEEILFAENAVEDARLEAVRAEEEKILAEKAVDDARLALEQARAEMEQKKLRETEAMRKEQARIAYHTRLEEEARRAAEIAIAEKARREAEEEMRREELERQAAEEALIIEVLEKDANEKSKAAEAAWLEAKAALDQVSNARRKILQKTIAQADLEALAEAEEIVMSQTEGYKEPPQLPPTKSELEAEQWETLRCEGRGQMTRRMLQGWTMLPELCRGKECANTPLLLSKDGRKVQCVVCDGCGNGIDGVYEAIDATYESDDEIEDEEEAADTGSIVEEAADTGSIVEEAADIEDEEEAADTSNLVDEDSSEDDASAMTEKESFEEPLVPPTPIATQSAPIPTTTQSVDELKEDFETKRTYVSKEIGRKMMQGWTLLDVSCDECMMPLMHNPDLNEETCVLCGTAVVVLPIFEEPKSQTRNDPAEDPPAANEDEEKPKSSVLEEEKLDTDLLVEEDPKEGENRLPEDPPTTADEDKDVPADLHVPEDPPTIDEDDDELDEELKEETLIEEKLTTDILDDEEPELNAFSSTASKDIADFLLAVPTVTEEDYDEFEVGCDTFEITKEVSPFPQSQAKPTVIEVGEQPDVIEEECAAELMSEPSLVKGPDEQPDVVEEQCEIEVAVIVSLTPDESPVPSPTLLEKKTKTAGDMDAQSEIADAVTPDEAPVSSPTLIEEERATVGDIVEQPEIAKEDEYTIELMKAASSFAAPSFDEAPVPVEKPTTAQPVKNQAVPFVLEEETPSGEDPPVLMTRPDIDEEDRAEELNAIADFSLAIEENYDAFEVGCDSFEITKEVSISPRSQAKPSDIKVGEQPDVFEEECAAELMSDPSLEPVLMKTPTADLDEEDSAEELKAISDFLSVSSVVAPSLDKKKVSRLPPSSPPFTAKRPPRPVSKVSTPPPTPPSRKRTMAKSPRAKRSPPKPEGKSPPPRPVPGSVSGRRQSPRAFNSHHSPNGFEMNDDDSAGSRMESVANSALDAILNRIEDCKTNLNESSDPEFIMTQLAMIEKLSTAAMAVRKLEEMA